LRKSARFAADRFENHALNLTAAEAKPFVPASDLQRSKQFCLALGFEMRWADGSRAYVGHGHTRFLLQACAEPR
jgi:hypothetical protein